MPTTNPLLGEILTELVENIHQVFWMTDPAKFQMVYISPAYEKIWGRTCESLYSDARSFVDAIHPDDRERIIQAFGKQIDGTYDEEYRIVQPTGQVRWIRDKAFVVHNQQGQVYRICGLAADITDQKNLEKTLEEHRVKILNASKLSALGEMAGGVAHEINTPLTTIITLASQLEEIIAEAEIDRPLVQGLLQNIGLTADRIAKIVKGLRSLSRDDSRDPMEYYSVSQLVDETIAFCSERFKYHGISLRIDPIPSDLMLQCRPTEISQVFLNLLNNAFDAIQASNSEDKWIEIKTLNTPGELTIAVTDSGVGISDEVRAKLFQPFFTTKDVGRGTGLGLSISRRILRDHAGELELNTDNRHTCFVLRFPKSSNRNRVA